MQLPHAVSRSDAKTQHYLTSKINLLQEIIAVWKRCGILSRHGFDRIMSGTKYSAHMINGCLLQKREPHPMEAKVRIYFLYHTQQLVKTPAS